MSHLFVTESGSNISIKGGYFVVTNSKGDSMSIPKETLEAVVIFGNSGITTPAIQELLERGIRVCYFSSHGKYYGMLESTSHKNIRRLKTQIHLSEDEEFTLNLSKRIINAKINNQQVVLRRYSNGDFKYQVKAIHEAMSNCRSNIKEAKSLQELLGYEGKAANYYFKSLSCVINKDFSFNGRNRQPPRDPFNSMLSLGYTLLMYEIYGYILSKGLSPYCGFLHKDHERHPTLASDLMEEWRAVLVDSLVLSLIQGKEVDRAGFTYSDQSYGCYLEPETMTTFIKKYDKKMMTVNSYIDGISMSYRRAISSQIDSLTKAIELKDVNQYNPILIR